MNEQHTINELAEAIYAIRPSEGACFEAGYALDQVAGHGFWLGAQCLVRQATDFDPSLGAYWDQAIMDRLRKNALTEAQSLRVAKTIAYATRAHAPFMDILALVSARLEKVYGVELPKLFLSDADRCRAGEAAVQYQGATKNASPKLGFLDEFAGSLALAALAGLHQNARKLTQSKVQLILGCKDDRSLRVGGMQVFLALTHFPHYLGSVELALVSDERVSSVFAIGSKVAKSEAA